MSEGYSCQQCFFCCFNLHFGTVWITGRILEIHLRIPYGHKTSMSGLVVSKKEKWQPGFLAPFLVSCTIQHSWFPALLEQSPSKVFYFFKKCIIRYLWKWLFKIFWSIIMQKQHVWEIFSPWVTNLKASINKIPSLFKLNFVLTTWLF